MLASLAIALLACLALGASAASAAAPVVTIEDAGNVGYTTAKVKGKVDPQDHETSHYFEYATKADFSNASQAGAGSLSEGAGETEVSADLTDLAPGTVYHLRLVAENTESERVEAVAGDFETEEVTKPVVSIDPVSSITDTTAHFSGEVTAGGSDPAFQTSCAFDYVPDAVFQFHANERQQFAIKAEGGTYYIRFFVFDGSGREGTTAPIAFDAPASGPGSVQAALEALPFVEPGSISVTGGPGDKDGSSPYVVDFAGPFSGSNQLNMEIHVTDLIPASSGFNATRVREGVPGGFADAKHVACDPNSVIGPIATSVSADPTSLEPNTTYVVRIRAENKGGSSEASTTFKTPGTAPLVNAFAAGPIQAERVSLNGEINPRNSPTTYWFEWGTEDCSANPCQAIPASKDNSAGDGRYFVYVLKQLEGLEPQTTYHFRLVAHNDSGTTEGKDQEFTTAAAETACANAGALGSNRLSSCRAWEMVSPLDKNGGYVFPQSQRTDVSAAGNAVTFAAGTAFGAPKGSAISNQFLSRRTAQPGTNGWSTHSIEPRGGSQTGNGLLNGGAPHYVGAYTPDLSAGLYESWRPLTDAPNVDTISNLYRIDGLDTQDLSPTLLSDSVTPLPKFIPGKEKEKEFLSPTLIGASTDLSHAVFEEPVNLTDDAPPQGLFCQLAGVSCDPRLYENANDTVRLVGYIPQSSATECDGADCAVSSNATAGLLPESNGALKTISADGSRILFQAGDDSYLREDGTRTYKLNASEKATPDSPQAATAWDMSRDGSRVFFSTNEALLKGDTDSNPSLYMYDLEKPAGERLTLISASAIADGYFTAMVGASDDGRYAYFTSYYDQLVPGESPPLGAGLYLWHDGDLTYIGSFETSGGENGTRSGAKSSRVSPDGRHLLFASSGDKYFRGQGSFSGYDHNGTSQFYVYDADSGRLTCATCNPSGEPATSSAGLDVYALTGVSAGTAHLTHAFSDDGRFVFFNSFEALVSEDTNGAWDAYQYNTENEEISLISSGTSSGDSFFTEASKDGRDVFFATSERLSGWDTDQSYDLYDARIGGGLPEPAPTTAPCNGDSCLPPSGPSAPVAPVASDKAGAGNPPIRCARGTRKVRRNGKARCQRRAGKHQSAPKHGRKANADRRAAK